METPPQPVLALMLSADGRRVAVCAVPLHYDPRQPMARDYQSPTGAVMVRMYDLPSP